MAWLYLLIAGLTEIVWAIGLKFTEGFTNLGPSVLTLLFIIVTFFLFAKAMTVIPIGTAYAVFTGIGAAGTAILGIILFDENAGAGKIVFLCLLIFGIVGLKVTDGENGAEEEAGS